MEIRFADNIWAKIPDITEWPVTKDLRSVLPTAGVYALLDNHGSILYIGQATDMRARIGEHTDVPYAQIRFLPLVDWRARYLVELAGILAFEPRYNKYPKELIGARKARSLNQRREGGDLDV